MGKFVNQKGKIRVLAFTRCGTYIYVCRKGQGIFANHSLEHAMYMARHGLFSAVRENYETVNRIVKQNSILKLRDQQPDGLLILQTPIQGKLPL